MNRCILLASTSSSFVDFEIADTFPGMVADAEVYRRDNVATLLATNSLRVEFYAAFATACDMCLVQLPQLMVTASVCRSAQG